MIVPIPPSGDEGGGERDFAGGAGVDGGCGSKPLSDEQIMKTLEALSTGPAATQPAGVGRMWFM
jgi:hypothetical protein